MSWENLIKDQSIFSMVIILLILITLSLDSVWILLGENCCWSLLALKRLIKLSKYQVLQSPAKLSLFKKMLKKITPKGYSAHCKSRNSHRAFEGNINNYFLPHLLNLGQCFLTFYSPFVQRSCSFFGSIQG